MNSTNRNAAAKKRCREAYSKLKAKKDHLALVRNTIAKKDQVNIHKARSRAKKRKNEDEQL